MTLHADIPVRPVMLPADLMSMCYITHRLREADRVECFAGRFSHPDQLAMDAISSQGFVDICWLGGVPVAAIGARQSWPGVWSVWAFGTDDWPRVALTLSKHAVRSLRPAMLKLNGHRAECASHVKHHSAHAWLEWMGFKREALMRGHGRNGEDFYLYAWRSCDVLQLVRRRDQQLAGSLSAEPGPRGACLGERPSGPH
jgi:hypothetical protein